MRPTILLPLSLAALLAASCGTERGQRDARRGSARDAPSCAQAVLSAARTGSQFDPSIDLGLWVDPTGSTRDSEAEFYGNLTEVDSAAAEEEEAGEIEDLLAGLQRRWPEGEDMPWREWPIGDRGGQGVELHIRSDAEATIVDVVTSALAAGLVVYDPQTDSACRPPLL